MSRIMDNSHQQNGDGVPTMRDEVLFEQIAAAFARTREFRSLVRALAPRAVETWAGRNRIKKALARPVAKSIEKGFAVPGGAERATPMADLFSDPKFLSSLSIELPALINGILASLESAIEGAASLPAGERTALCKNLAAGIDTSRAGTIITGLARLVNGLHEDDPRFLAEALRPKIADFIAGADFGELKEMLEGSMEDIAALSRAVNEELWNYPAKVICLLSAAPTAANMVMTVLRESAAPMNRMAPDLLADVLFALVERIDARGIGHLINECCELTRKIHTGSALLGDPGKPKFPGTAAKLARETLATVDIDLLLKARNLINEMREMAITAFMDLLEEHPALARDLIRGPFNSLAASLRRFNRRTGAIEELLTDDEAARELARGFGEIDVQELAAALSRACGLFNRMHEKKPGFLRDTLSQIMSSLEGHETAATAQRITADIVEALKPLAPEILPPLIRGVAELLKEDDGTGEMKEALALLRNVINGKEAGI